MPELFLKFTDEQGESREVLVEGDKFEIGRHSENDLTFTNSAVSRQHLKIELFSHIYTITDVGSTLGTTLNGEKLNEPKVLKNGDVLLLGDSLKIEVALEEDEYDAEDEKRNSPVAEPNSSANASVATASSSANSGGIPNSFFYLAPIFGLIVLLGVGGLFFFSGNAKTTDKIESENDDDFVYSTDRRKKYDDELTENSSKSSDPISKTPTPEISSTIQTNDDEPPVESSTPDNSKTPEIPNLPKNSGDLGKIEISSAQFLRKIAQSDPKAFLTGAQQQIVKSKIDQLKNSSSLAANIKSAKANATRIMEIANAKNVKPQFLAVAAIAKLGNNSGDVATAAQNMAGILDEMSRNVGTERADDALLTIASYDQGAAGKNARNEKYAAGFAVKISRQLAADSDDLVLKGKRFDQ